MTQSTQEISASDSLDDMFEPAMVDGLDDELDGPLPTSSDKQVLAEKRRRTEQRLEQRRLREELGCYDLELGDF
jgi:hypothetical protein